MVSLKIAVKDNKLIKVRDTLMIEDTINGIKCLFEFRTDWSNLRKTIVFARGHIFPAITNPQTISLLLDESNECIVPPEILSEAGEFSIGLIGEDDEQQIVTNWLYYKTQWGCYDAGIAPNPPTPSVYEEILGALGNKSDVDHTHNEYITKDEANDLIEDSVSQAVEEGFELSLDAGRITERND